MPVRVISPSGGDDYPAAQAALNECIDQGKELWVKGMLQLSAPLIASAAYSSASGYQGVVIKGFSAVDCGFKPYSAGADGITLLKFDNSRGGYLVMCEVRNLKFSNRISNNTYNNLSNPKTAGFGLELNGTSIIRVSNCTFTGQYNCIGLTGGDVNGSATTLIENCSFYSFQKHGILAQPGPELWIEHCQAYNPGGSPIIGSVFIKIESRDTIHLRMVDCVNIDIGCWIKTASTTLNINGVIVLDQVMMDTGGTGFIFDGTGDNIDEIHCRDCWASYNANQGVIIKGSALKSVHWVGGIIQTNYGGGVDIQSGDATDCQHIIDGAQILGNLGFGVNVASGIGGVTVRNNRITNPVNYGVGSTQQYGVKFNGSHTNMRVTGNDLRGNTISALNGDYSGASNRVSNNLGVNPSGALGPPVVPASTTAYTNAYGVDCTVFVNGGTVSAVAIGGTTTGQTGGMFRVPAGQTITLTYSSAPTWTWFGD